MATVISTMASHFHVGVSPRGFVLVEKRGLVVREVCGPEPTPGDMHFLALQLNGCDGPTRDAYLRQHGCRPIDEIAGTPFKGILV